MRLKEIYHKKVIPELLKSTSNKNPMSVPALKKACVNVGIGNLTTNPKSIVTIEKELAAITGQKAITRAAKKAISGFKLRKGQKIGLSIILRKGRMYDFVEKIINLVLPRIRDFRGLDLKGFDKHGNYSLGFKEQIVFPEIKYDKTEFFYGLQITIVTSAKNDIQAKMLLELLGFPFKKVLYGKKKSQD